MALTNAMDNLGTNNQYQNDARIVQSFFVNDSNANENIQSSKVSHIIINKSDVKKVSGFTDKERDKEMNNYLNKSIIDSKRDHD